MPVDQHSAFTCPICYATAAVVTVLLAAAYVRICDWYLASRRPRPWYRSNIKLPRTRADDFETSTP